MYFHFSLSQSLTVSFMNNSDDDRIVCPHCGRKIIPRLSFYGGRPNARWCPYCTGNIDDYSAWIGIVIIAVLVAAYVYFVD